MLKGQSDIISAVIIIIIAVGLVGTAYTWGLPLIQKQQDTALVERATNYFSNDNVNSIQKKITLVATNGNADTFTGDISGLWQLVPNGVSSVNNNSLSFTFFSRVTNIATGQWVSLNGVSCTVPPGSVGEDSYAVCARADTLRNGYNITYRVQFRPLLGSTGFEIYLVQNPSGLLTSTAKVIRVSAGNSYSTTVKGQNLIITEVKVLLG